MALAASLERPAVRLQTMEKELDGGLRAIFSNPMPRFTLSFAFFASSQSKSFTVITAAEP
jgi:hypothetical protein